MELPFDNYKQFSFPLITIAIYKAPNYQELRRREKAALEHEMAGAFKRFANNVCSFLSKRKPPLDSDAGLQIVAAARFTVTSNILVVKNTAADDGYGPTLYAVLLELARAWALEGASPYNQPGKVAKKAKNIWLRFKTHSDYENKVLTSQLPISSGHSESWLNEVYSLTGRNPLISIKPMCKRGKNFLEIRRKQKKSDIVFSQRLSEFLEKSVEAYKA